MLNVIFTVVCHFVVVFALCVLCCLVVGLYIRLTEKTIIFNISKGNVNNIL